MYKSTFIYSYYMYRWHSSIYVSMFSIGYCMCHVLLARCVSTVVFMLVFVSYNNTKSSFS